MEKTFVCIVCPNGCTLHAAEENGVISVTGNRCPKGEEYAKAELTNPVRTLTTSVATVFPDRPVLPVRTSGAIPKDAIMPAMRVIAGLRVNHAVACGDVIAENFMGFGVDLVATDDLRV